jgi:hypothetical protein
VVSAIKQSEGHLFGAPRLLQHGVRDIEGKNFLVSLGLALHRFVHVPTHYDAWTIHATRNRSYSTPSTVTDGTPRVAANIAKLPDYCGKEVDDPPIARTTLPYRRNSAGRLCGPAEQTWRRTAQSEFTIESKNVGFSQCSKAG